MSNICIHGFVVNSWRKYMQEQRSFCLCLSNASSCWRGGGPITTSRSVPHNCGSKLCNPLLIVAFHFAEFCLRATPEKILSWLAKEGRSAKKSFRYFVGFHQSPAKPHWESGLEIVLLSSQLQRSAQNSNYLILTNSDLYICYVKNGG